MKASTGEQKKTIREAVREVEIREEVDVVVCGGGSAGICAALAAARMGMRVTLVESYGFLGGVTTAMGVNGIGGFQHDLDGSPMIQGIPMEIMKRLAALEGTSKEWVDRISRPKGDGAGLKLGLNCYWVQANPEIMKIVLDQMMEESGVRLLYHCNAVWPIMDGDRITGVFVESKSGRQAIVAKTVIDCTGDGDIAARAGAEFHMGRSGDGACQPMTMIFTIANSDVEEFYRVTGDPKYPMAYNRYEEAMRIAREKGEIVLNPNDIFCAATYVNHRSYAHPADTVSSVNFTRVQNMDATNVDDLTQAEIMGRKQVMEAVQFMRKYMHMFRNAALVSMPAHIGIRESRRIVGEHMLTGEEVMNGVAHHDSIARGMYTLDIHNPTEIGKPSVLTELDQPYDIPYRALVPKRIENLLVAGRCISGDAIALSSYRIQSHCMAMGEAAGTAAAQAVESGQSVRDIDTDKLRERLKKNGAHIGPNQ